MDQRDQELLEKQLRRISPKRSDDIMILALVAAFFGGIALGGILFAHEEEPTRTAFNQAGTYIQSITPR